MRLQFLAFHFEADLVIHHIKRATRHLIFWTLIAVAIGLTGVRLLLSGIEYYKSDLVSHISEVIGTPVTIGGLGANMRGFNPQLVLKDIAISSPALPVRPSSSVAAEDKQKPAVEFNEIRLGIDLLELLARRDLLSSSWVTLVGAKLSIKRKQDGSIAIVGLKSSDGQPQWLLQGRKYEVLQSEITWQDDISHSKPLLFSGVNLAISNRGGHHRLNMLADLPEKTGNTLRLSMDFNGNIFEPSTIQGRVYIEGKAVLLSELAALGQASVWQRFKINAGTGDFKIWGDWRQSQLAAMDVEAQLQQVAVVRQDKQEFFVNRLNTRLHWGLNNTGKQWQLDLGDFSLETRDSPQGAVKKWPAAVFSVSGQHRDDNALSKIALFIERLDLQQASRLVQFFAPLADEPLKLLAQAQIKGVLENFSLFTDQDTKSFALNGGFSGIAMAPILSIPGIENLTGRIKGSEQQGTMRLTTKDARLSVPDLFRDVLPVDRLQGALSWQQADNVWSVSSQMIELDSLSFQSKSRFRIDIPETGEPIFMDLQSSFAGEDARQVTRYFPVGIMSDGVVAWLDRAFARGSMTNGGVLVYGNLNDFPFTDAPGVFEAVFNGEQFDLSYDSEWPQITGMNAEVMFSQGGLEVNVLQGQSDKVVIKQARVTIPSLSKSKHLLIQGEAEAGIAQVLAFMQHTPLRSPVDSLLEAIAPQGNTHIALDLKIPLVDDAPTRVDGTAQFNGARLMVKSLDLPVSNIRGQLKFDEQGIFSDDIQATALDEPIRINIESSDSQTTVNVAGKASIDNLQAQFDLPWWRIAAGATEYQLKLGLPYGDISSELVVKSTLSGVSLDLPGVLAKTREQRVPMSLTFSLGDKPLVPVLLNYDNKLKAALQLDSKKKTVFSGHVLLGAGEVAQRQEPGIKLEINRDHLALQDWLGLAAAQGAGDAVRELSIHSDHALWQKTDVGLFNLDLKRDGNHWAGVIVSAFAAGSIQIPVDFNRTDRIILDMARLDLSALKQLGSKGALVSPILSPELMPLLTIASDKTLWQSVDLGRLSLETRRIPGGMSFNNAQLIGANQKLSLSGDWQTIGGKSVTHIQGHLDAPRTGQLLEKLGITKDITETTAVVDFSINWNAAPHQFSLAGLQGGIDIKLKNGRILSIEPGFGRVLGMLAMAQWIKRAQLDFSDIYQEGLTFNSIQGHFDLAGGIASTYDLVVDAVPAKIAISGDTDLVSQTVDHIVNVTPKSADAVPIAGTIIGKMAALIGKSLTGKNQEGFFFGSQYLVKGAWDNAQIIPMHKNNGLLQKTWDGIVGFPWLQQEETTQQLEK